MYREITIVPTIKTDSSIKSVKLKKIMRCGTTYSAVARQDFGFTRSPKLIKEQKLKRKK